MTPADWTVFQQTISKSQQTPDLEFTDLSIWEAAAALHNNLNYEIHGTWYFDTHLVTFCHGTVCFWQL